MMGKSNEIGARLRAFRSGRGLNQQDFAAMMEVSYSMLQKYEQGRSLPGAESLAKLNQYFDLNINWLLTGQGSMTATSVARPEGHWGLPLLSMAGINAGAVTEDGIREGAIQEPDYGYFPTHYLERCLPRFSPDLVKWLFMAQAPDNKMTPTIFQDEVVMVCGQPGISFQQGGIYLLRNPFENLPAIRRVFLTEKVVLLHCDNVQHKMTKIPIPDDQALENLIVGRVCWTSRILV